jgi:polyphenol oxidase
VTVPAAWLAPEWRIAGVGALMTTRRGGVSSGPYAAMNVGIAVGDDPQAVATNRGRLAEATGAAPVFLRQVHGRRVARVAADDAAAGATVHEADAAVTTVPGVACIVQAADCLPVLLAAPDGRAVGAAHAGWRGLAAGVVEATVDAVCAAAGCAPADLSAWLGACIGPDAFEVGADVLAAFAVAPQPDSGDASAAHRFRAKGGGKWLADLAGLTLDRLAAAGVSRVDGGCWCTVSDPERFFSFRRDGTTGRMAAAIWINSRGDDTRG